MEKPELFSRQAYHFHKLFLIFLIHILYIPVKFVRFLSGHPGVRPYCMDIMVCCPTLRFPHKQLPGSLFSMVKLRCQTKNICYCFSIQHITITAYSMREMPPLFLSFTVIYYSMAALITQCTAQTLSAIIVFARAEFWFCPRFFPGSRLKAVRGKNCDCGHAGL